MTERDAVEAVLSARRGARRLGREFEVDEAKMRAAGFTKDQIRRVRNHVTRIEHVLEVEMARIDGEERCR